MWHVHVRAVRHTISRSVRAHSMSGIEWYACSDKNIPVRATHSEFASARCVPLAPGSGDERAQQRADSRVTQRYMVSSLHSACELLSWSLTINHRLIGRASEYRARVNTHVLATHHRHSLKHHWLAGRTVNELVPDAVHVWCSGQKGSASKREGRKHC
jgi:hypothetical protein